MLAGKLTLHDVQDVEAHCGKALHDALRDFRAHLGPDDREDAHAFFIGQAWELSCKYDPERGWSFSKWVFAHRRYWLVEWYRQRFPGSRIAGERPVVLSLDTDQSRPGRTLSVLDSLPAPDRDPDGIPRALSERRRHRARDLEELREALLARDAA